MTTHDLFGSAEKLPPGFVYEQRFLPESAERDLLAEFACLPFEHFQFHGFEGRRRVASYHWRYDFNGGGLQKADDPPPFLIEVRENVARLRGALLPSSPSLRDRVYAGRCYRLAPGQARVW